MGKQGRSLSLPKQCMRKRGLEGLNSEMFEGSRRVIVVFERLCLDRCHHSDVVLVGEVYR